MNRVKYLSIRILIPALLVAGLAFGMYSPGHDIKPVVVVDKMLSQIPSDSAYFIVMNREVKEVNGKKEVGYVVDSTGSLHYAVAIEKEDRFELHFIGDFKSLMSLCPPGNLTVYVHGDGKMLEKTLWRTSLMKELYGTNLLIFSWPTRNPELNGLKNFHNSMSVAQFSTKQFSQFLHELEEYQEESGGSQFENTSILFHSLGNYLLENTVKEGLLEDLNSDLFDASILNSAATESKNHAKWISKLHMQKNVYVVSSKHDVNLMGAQYFTSLPLLLGREVTGDRVPGVTYVDMTDALGFSFKRSKSHTYFVGEGPADNPVITRFYKNLLTNNNHDLAACGTIDTKKNNFVVSAP